MSAYNFKALQANRVNWSETLDEKFIRVSASERRD